MNEFEHLLDRTSAKRVGVMVSGGVDSALLLYLILSENATVGRDVRIFTVPKRDGAALHARNVVTAICSDLGMPPMDITLVGSPSLPHHVQVSYGINVVFTRNWADVMYIADNVTPGETFNGLEPKRVRTVHPRIEQPFFYLTKDKILERYFELGIQHLLIPTHSCTELAEGRCNECWQCNERAWAFKQIQQVDPGTS